MGRHGDHFGLGACMIRKVFDCAILSDFDCIIIGDGYWCGLSNDNVLNGWGVASAKRFGASSRFVEATFALGIRQKCRRTSNQPSQPYRVGWLR